MATYNLHDQLKALKKLIKNEERDLKTREEWVKESKIRLEALESQAQIVSDHIKDAVYGSSGS